MNYIGHVIVLSTAHLTPETREWLAGVARTRPPKGFICADTGTGWFVSTPPLPDTYRLEEVDGHDDLDAVWSYARDKGCAYVLFEREAEVSAELPTY